MKKLLIGLFLSTIAFSSFGETNPATENRIYFSKNHWVYRDSLVFDPPFVSLWTGVNIHYKDPKAKSSKIYMTFDCKKHKFRFESQVDYSLPDNKGERLGMYANTSIWYPIEPETVFAGIFKGICR